VQKVVSEATYVTKIGNWRSAQQYSLEKFRTLLHFGHQISDTFLILDKVLSKIKNVRDFCYLMYFIAWITN